MADPNLEPVRVSLVKRFSFVILGLIAVLFVSTVFWFNVKGYSFAPNKAALVLDDLDRFVEAVASLDTVTSEGDSLEIVIDYLDNASRGLKDYASTYSLTPERLLRRIRSDKNIYRQADELTERIRAQQEEILRSFVKFKEYFPRAVFPPVYFFIGDKRAAGSVSASGILISAEVYSGDLLDEDRLFRSTSLIPTLVIHELVHFNQSTFSPIGYATKWDNLARAWKEGSADYIAELVTGRHINQRAHDYGRVHAAALWAEYRDVLDSSNTGDWFWVTPDDSERPQDLGYFMGYELVEAYVEANNDRSAAIRSLVTSSSYRKMFAIGDYHP